MLNLRNDVSNIYELIKQNKKIIIYGAGASTKLLLEANYHKGLNESLAFIVDRNEGLDETFLEAGEDIRVKIVSLKSFCSKYARQMNDYNMLITPYTALTIVMALDKIEELNHLDTYIYSLIVNKKKPKSFSLRNVDRPLIPKIIHYFWIGGNPMPEEDKRNIESWRKYAPDYEIIEWNESNYDFSVHPYCYDALKNKQYMYATDYARKDILYRYGGIYLDTDVELVAPLDDLLYNDVFIGIDDGGQLNSGSGLGAVPNHPVIKTFMELYEGVNFVNPDGSFNYKYNTYYETKYMISRGFKIKNEFQLIDGISCFPREVFMPEGFIGLYDDYTSKTVANHKINPYDKTGVRKILHRMKQ